MPWKRHESDEQNWPMPSYLTRQISIWERSGCHAPGNHRLTMISLRKRGMNKVERVPNTPVELGIVPRRNAEVWHCHSQWAQNLNVTSLYILYTFILYRMYISPWYNNTCTTNSANNERAPCRATRRSDRRNETFLRLKETFT